MENVSSKDFKSYIKKNELSPVYIFSGEEKYLLKNAQASLEKLVGISETDTFNRNEFSNNASVDDIADAALALPFMAEKKIVIVKDFDIESKNAVELSKLQELTADLSDMTVLIFTYPTILVDKRKAKWKDFIKNLPQNAVVVNFDKMDFNDLSKFVIKQAERGGSSISKVNANKLIEYVGTDMNSLKNEVDKLCALVSGEEINSEYIEKSVVKNLETTVFIMIKSIIQGNYSKAYVLLNLLFERREEPVNILARISDSFVDLYRVRAALQSGKTATAPAKYGNYKGKEFVLNNAERDLRNFSTEKLRKCLKLLLESDVLLKSSRISGKIVLEELLAKLIIINKGANAKG